MSALTAELIKDVKADLAAARSDEGSSDHRLIIGLKRELLDLNAQAAEEAGHHDRAREIREARDEWLIALGEKP